MISQVAEAALVLIYLNANFALAAKLAEGIAKFAIIYPQAVVLKVVKSILVHVTLFGLPET